MFRLFPVLARKLKLWPNKPAELKVVVEAYYVKIGNVSRRLLGSLSLIIGMDSNDLPELHKEMQISMRVNYYPVCYSQSSVQMSVISEYTCMILLEAEKGIKGKTNSAEKGKGKKGASHSSEKKEVCAS
ncbi:hypothetical protein AgCh_040217 [Apium graveolens]